jgi:hypothetical protein
MGYHMPIQALLDHVSLNTSQGYIDATANATRQAARANRTYRALDGLHSKPASGGTRERRIATDALDLT